MKKHGSSEMAQVVKNIGSGSTAPVDEKPGSLGYQDSGAVPNAQVGGNKGGTPNDRKGAKQVKGGLY